MNWLSLNLVTGNSLTRELRLVFSQESNSFLVIEDDANNKPAHIPIHWRPQQMLQNIYLGLEQSSKYLYSEFLNIIPGVLNPLLNTWTSSANYIQRRPWQKFPFTIKLSKFQTFISTVSWRMRTSPDPSQKAWTSVTEYTHSALSNLNVFRSILENKDRCFWIYQQWPVESDRVPFRLSGPGHLLPNIPTMSCRTRTT